MSAPISQLASADVAAGVWFSPETVYVRAGTVEGRPVFMICDAEGAELAAAPTRELAFAVARQNGLEPISAH